jgi:hypothetical protein
MDDIQRPGAMSSMTAWHSLSSGCTTMLNFSDETTYDLVSGVLEFT